MHAGQRLSNAPRGRHWLALGLALGASSLSATAHAGNDEGILVGGYASITGGAVTATVSDGSSAWYNPAGLAHTTQQKFDLNASVYGISVTSSGEAFQVVGGAAPSASVIDWQLIPSVLSYVRNINPRMVGAFSIIVPTTEDRDIRATDRAPDGTDVSLGIDRLKNEYDYIISLAWRLEHKLSVGASLHGIYISTEQLEQFGVGKPGMPNTSLAVSSTHQTLGDFGVRLGVGMQWRATDKLEVGVSAQTPTLTALRKVYSSSVKGGYSPTNGAGYESASEDEMKGVWDLSSPFVLRVGIAYRYRRSQVLVDGSMYSPLDAAGQSFDRKWMANGRIGCIVQVSENYWYGLGAFTDFHGTREPAPNFAGISGGVRLAQRLHIKEGGRELAFFTTLAGRYAYGWSGVRGVSVETENGVFSFANTLGDVHVHEMAFNLGSGVTF